MSQLFATSAEDTPPTFSVSSNETPGASGRPICTLAADSGRCAGSPARLRPVAHVERLLDAKRFQSPVVRRRQAVQPVGAEQPAPADPAAVNGLVPAEVAEIRGAFERDQPVHGGGYPFFPSYP